MRPRLTRLIITSSVPVLGLALATPSAMAATAPSAAGRALVVHGSVRGVTGHAVAGR